MAEVKQQAPEKIYKMYMCCYVMIMGVTKCIFRLIFTINLKTL